MTGGQLQRLLDLAGLTQRGAAKELDINERTMRKYVAGDASIPRAIEYALRWIIYSNDELRRAQRRTDNQ